MAITRNRALRVLRTIRRIRRERVFFIVGALGAVIVLSAAGIYILELGDPTSQIKTFGDALWWAVETIATVGYGDVVPKTPGGRILAAGTILGGVGLLSIITATIASVFVERKIREERGLEPTRLKDHVVLCGWNPWAEEILEGLIRELGDKRLRLVLLNELNPEVIEEIRQKYNEHEIEFVWGNFTNEGILRRANVSSALAVIVVPDTSGGRTLERADERTILASLAIKSLAPHTRTCAELLDPSNRSHLQRANVDEIIVRGEGTGLVVAASALSPGFKEVLEQILSTEADYGIIRYEIPKGLVGRTVRELKDHVAREREGLLLALVKEPPTFNLSDLLSHDMSAIDLFIKRKFEEAELPMSTKAGRYMVKVNPKDTDTVEEGEVAFIIGPRGA